MLGHVGVHELTLHDIVDPEHVVLVEKLVGPDLGGVLDEPAEDAVDPHVEGELLGRVAREADGGHAVGGGLVAG